MNICVQIDAANPGEVLACCGLAVLASRRSPDVVTGFERRGGSVTFVGPEAHLATLLMNVEPDTTRPKIGNVALDWWEPWGTNPQMKLWAGQQCPQGIAHTLWEKAGQGTNEHWLEFAVPMAGRLGVDPAGTWNALDLGWSVNEHSTKRDTAQMLCRPFVELLAMVGLQEFFVPGTKEEGFRYCLWRAAPYLVARTAFRGHGHHVLAECHLPTGKNGKYWILKYADVNWRPRE